MRSSPTEDRFGLSALLLAAMIGALAAFGCGCIADTAEDSDLPWASGQSWEGLMPLPGGMMDRYD